MKDKVVFYRQQLIIFCQSKIRMSVWNELINIAAISYTQKPLNLFELVDGKNNESTKNNYLEDLNSL